jgi:hypothetical protein
MSKLVVSSNGLLLQSLGLLTAMKASNKIMNLTKSFHRFVEDPSKAIPAAFRDPVKIGEWIQEYAKKSLNPEGLRNAALAITAEKIGEEVLRMRTKLSKEVLSDTQAELLSNALVEYESHLKVAVRNAIPLVRAFQPAEAAAPEKPAAKERGKKEKKEKKETVVVE